MPSSTRLELFAKNNSSFESIPPMQSALIQHLNCATYQAACVWDQILAREIKEEDPGEWGWKHKSDGCSIFLTDLPAIAQSCQQLTKCQCKFSCCG